MSRNKLAFLILTVLICILVNCNGASSPLTALSPPQTEAATDNAEASNESTSVLPTLTPNLTLHNSAPSTSALTTSSFNQPVVCANLQAPSSINPELGFPGVLGLIILFNPPPNAPFDYSFSQAVLLGGQPFRERILLPSRQGVREIGFSPSGEWFAYQKNPGDLQGEPPSLFLHLISDKGKTLITLLPLQEAETSGYWFSKWLNNELMLITYGLPPRTEGESRNALTIFNPFTGERHDELLDDLPYWNRETAIYFSPDMTRAVYVGRTEEDSILVLWDVEQRKILWQQSPFISDVRFDEVGIGTTEGFGNIAIWSPDSAGFVFSAVKRTEDSDSQYFSSLVDREGEQEQILISTFNRENDLIIYGGAWSPDQRYLVYFRSNSILLHDFIFNEVIELCAGLPPYISQALWSPDSNYLAFMSPVDGQQHLLVLNIYTGDVFSTREIRNFFPAGWFANEDWLIIPEVDIP